MEDDRFTCPSCGFEMKGTRPRCAVCGLELERSDAVRIREILREVDGHMDRIEMLESEVRRIYEKEGNRS